MTSGEAARLLEELKRALVPLVSTVTERADAVDASCLEGDFPADRQERLLKAIAGELLPAGRWRLDPTAHPFATLVSLGDVRITTHYDDRHLAPALFSMLHELGHGL